tara:strand:+ start:287 stop:721 length:435 start_codon:yes stop_codon:yes gene_type:complete
MNKPQINIKWTYGDPYEKTSAKSSNPFQNENEKASFDYEREMMHRKEKRIKEIEKFAVGESSIKQMAREFTNSDEDPQLLYQNIAQQGFQKKENKREDQNNKMLEREMIMQTNQNPFMIKNNYVDDLTVQDEFLKPKNSSYENR